MSKIDINDASGKKVGSADLSVAVFGIEPNVPVMHQVVVAQRAARRQGTSNTKTRSLVNGGGRKPWRQKGTGHARQGTIRAPQWKGGGVVFGPHPRSYAYKVPSKVVKLAMRSALSAKLADKELRVVEDFNFEKPSTKAAISALSALGLSGKKLTIVISDNDVNSYLSFRNIPKTRILGASEANTYDLIDNASVVFTVAALKQVEEVLA
jgi:large subunit ribosomal protein L4